jgi:hypothetical protein
LNDGKKIGVSLGLPLAVSPTLVALRLGQSGNDQEHDPRSRSLWDSLFSGLLRVWWLMSLVVVRVLQTIAPV